MFNEPREVLRWLTKKGDDSTAYLDPLVFGRNAKMGGNLTLWKELADYLRSYPEFIEKFFQHENWRYHLVGNTIAILQHATTFENIIVHTLLNNSWVAPQLAAGFALLTTGQMISPLETYLSTASIESNPKTFISAYYGLTLSGNHSMDYLPDTELFKEILSHDHDNCTNIAVSHWKFWKQLGY